MDSSTVTQSQIEIEEKTKSPNVVVLHNDDFNTFEHVYKCLMEICKMDGDRAWQCTLDVHFRGKSVVAEGDDEHLTKIKLCLMAEGLSVTIESA